MAIPTNYDLTSTQRAEHEKRFGGYNDLPPNWTEMSQEEFAQSHFFTYTPSMIEYRQMIVSRNEPMISAHLHHYSDGSGIALVNDFWKGTVKYYKFHDCAHDNVKLIEAGNCWSRSKCIDCGRVFFVDSSD